MKNKTARSSRARKFALVGVVVVAIAALGSGGLFISHRSASAQVAPSAPPRDLFEIQLGTGGSTRPTFPRDCSNHVSGWGTTGLHASGGGNGEATCIQVRVNPHVTLSSAYTQDFRVCLSADEEISCTPWASRGGGAGNVAQSHDGNILSSSIWVELGDTLPNKRISNVSAGVQFFFKKNDEACRGSSGAAFSSGYQESGWAYGEQQDNDPGCAQMHLSVTVVDPPIYDAQHANDSLPTSAGSNQPISAEVSMQNDGNNLAASWVSDTTVPGTETAVWTHGDGTVQSLANCDSYVPAEDAGTCTDTRTVTAANYKLKLTASTLPGFTAGAVFPYRNYITARYSSVFIRQGCFGGGNALAPGSPGNGGFIERALSLIIPRAHAEPVPIDEYPPDCDPNAGGWTVHLQQNRPENVAPGSQVAFPVAFNTGLNTPTGDYTLTFSMVKLDGPAQGVRDDGTFGHPFTAPLHIAGAAGFGLSCETASQEVLAGSATQYTVRVTAQNGWTGDVAVSVAGLPAGASSPGGTVTPTNSVIVPVFTSTSTPGGTSTLTFTAKPVGAETPTAVPCTSQLSVIGDRGPKGPVVSLRANPTSTVPGGQSTLTWTVGNAVSCTASASPANSAWTGAVANTSGNHTKPVTLNASTLFSIQCANSIGDREHDDATVNVTGSPSSPTLTLQGSPAHTTVGGTASFIAWYDQDGAGGSAAPVDVTVPAAWASQSNSVASTQGDAGVFRGNSVGTADITASYQGLTAPGQVIVDGTGGGGPLSVTLQGSANISQFPWGSSISGTAPLNAIDLRATTQNGTSTYNYTFYCDRSDNGTNITPGFAVKVDGTASLEDVERGACSYPGPGTYHPKVVVENGANAAQAHIVVNVAPCTGSSCPCSGASCTPLSCTFDATNPVLIPVHPTTTLTWNCNRAAQCAIDNVTDGGRLASNATGNGSTQDRPPYTTRYRLSCENNSVTIDKTVHVLDFNTRIEILPH